MYKKILAAVNEHLNSEIAARYALQLARTCQAKLYLCFIAEGRLPSSSFERGEEAMKRLFLEGRGMGIEVESITETGDPLKQIARTVRQEGIDLVFAATRREDARKRFYTDTKARRLFLDLSCSVALVRVVQAGKLRPSRILVPLGSRIDQLKERVYFTSRIAEAFHAKVCLFHAPAPLKKLFQQEAQLTVPEWEKKLPRDISEYMRGLQECQIRVTAAMAPAAVGRGIAMEAAFQRHDLILMGASRRSLLDFWVHGSPVEHLLREAPCNLVILRAVHADS